MRLLTAVLALTITVTIACADPAFNVVSDNGNAWTAVTTAPGGGAGAWSFSGTVSAVSGYAAAAKAEVPSDNVSKFDPPTPEPTSLILLGLACGGTAFLRRRQRTPRTEGYKRAA